MEHTDIRTFFGQLQMRQVEADADSLTMDMPVTPALVNTRGGLQGGLVATLVDVVAGTLADNALPDELSAATGNLNLHFLEPVLVGPARARATMVRRGGRSMVVQVEVHDAGTNTLAVIGTVGFSIVRLPAARAPVISDSRAPAAPG